MRGRGYNIPNVPYTMYFYKGYAIHGAFWHNRFGTPVSHGCINLPVQQARKLYNWTSTGTLVVVRR
jgi:lipoprotein-anchoring transpeptidase ErfK/SrfK